MFEKYILDNKLNLINSVCDLIGFPSISEETNDSDYPFGKECANALNYFLKLANKLGFKTKNVNGYCGWVEFGEGKDLIGIVGHLDVVPANENDWIHAPFIPTISDNKIYGRGAIDDKGPVIASLYAMKSVMDYANENNIPINKRIRLIVGLNEEKDWKCIEYYRKHEEIPILGFSPDSDFPCIYAEKSVISLSISDKINSSPIIIEEINYGNNAINVVPKFCSVKLKANSPNLLKNLIYSCNNSIKKHNYNIDLYKIDDYHIKLSSQGIASHSAHPELGENSIAKLIIVLSEVFNDFRIPFPILSDFYKLIGDDYSGKNLNLNLNDESGSLTLNTSQFYIKDEKIYININLRVPVHTDPNYIVETFRKNFNEDIDIIRIQNPLYVDKNTPLVQKLCSVFNNTCNTNLEPIAIGGATYARAFDNFVCFGMNFPGDEDMCHKSDEFVDIDKLILATNIYANAIYELLK